MANYKYASELGAEYVLITDSQDIRAILETIGKLRYMHNVYALLVLVGEGEYLEVYASQRFVVCNDTVLHRLA